MNKIILIGNLTRDPELTETPNGNKVAKFALAVKRPRSEETDFFNIVVWRGLAENCAKYLTKGNKIALEGYAQTRNYEDNDGVKRNVTEIIADNIEFLTPKQQQVQDEDVPPPPVRPSRQQLSFGGVTDDDLPF